MRAQFEVAIGSGKAGATLAFERARDRVRRRPLLIAIAFLLTLPFAVALTVNGIAEATGNGAAHVLPAWLGGYGNPGFARVMTLGPPLALVILAVSRIRLHVDRGEGRWVGRISADLTTWELAIGFLALAIVTIFFGHLVADSWACANGVKSAC
jgi:hypothetical protein